MTLEPIRTDVNTVLMANFANPVLDVNNNYKIYGMTIPAVTISGQIEASFDYVSELLGDGAMVAPSNYRKIVGFMADYASLLLLDVMDGLIITTHFNYSSGGLNVQKPAVGQMASLHEKYTKRCNRWRKILLTRAIVAKPSDLDMFIINEEAPVGSGIELVTYDAPNL
jgi:hypothetical protein